MLEDLSRERCDAPWMGCIQPADVGYWGRGPRVSQKEGYPPSNRHIHLRPRGLGRRTALVSAGNEGQRDGNGGPLGSGVLLATRR